MKQPVGVVALCIVCLLLGAALQKYYDTHRSTGPVSEIIKPQPETGTPVAADTSIARAEVDLAGEPLFAYGFLTPAKPGDKAAPQGPPTRNLRPNQALGEQTRPRHVDGSSASYSLVDVRDGSNVIDWFPGEHPPMTDDELKAAAEYFASLKWRPWTRVVETDMVPRTKVVGDLFMATDWI